jgi:hypothetical protein
MNTQRALQVAVLAASDIRSSKKLMLGEWMPYLRCAGYLGHPFEKNMFHHVDHHALESVMSGALELWYASPGQFRQLLIHSRQQDHSCASLGSTPSPSTSTSVISKSRSGPARGA